MAPTRRAPHVSTGGYKARSCPCYKGDTWYPYFGILTSAGDDIIAIALLGWRNRATVAYAIHVARTDKRAARWTIKVHFSGSLHWLLSRRHQGTVAFHALIDRMAARRTIKVRFGGSLHLLLDFLFFRWAVNAVGSVITYLSRRYADNVFLALHFLFDALFFGRAVDASVPTSTGFRKWLSGQDGFERPAVPVLNCLVPAKRAIKLEMHGQYI